MLHLTATYMLVRFYKVAAHGLVAGHKTPILLMLNKFETDDGEGGDLYVAIPLKTARERPCLYALISTTLC